MDLLWGGCLVTDINGNSKRGPRSVAERAKVNFLFLAVKLSSFSLPHDLSQTLTIWSLIALFMKLRLIILALL